MKPVYDAKAAALAGAKDRAITRQLVMTILQEYCCLSLFEQAELLEEIANIKRREVMTTSLPTLERITTRHADEPNHPSHKKLARYRAEINL